MTRNTTAKKQARQNQTTLNKTQSSHLQQQWHKTSVQYFIQTWCIFTW